MSDFVIDKLPERVRYRAGEEISFEGIAFSFEGRPVPVDAVLLSVPEGETWKRGDKSLDVVARYEEYEAVFTLRRKRRVLVPLLLFLVAALIAAGAFFLFPHEPVSEPDTGSRIYDGLGMSDDEIRAELQRQVDEGMMTVSVSPEPVLSDDGYLRINFIVPEDNNGISERCEIVQGDAVIYASGYVEPGYGIEWAYVPDAVPGSALVRVAATDKDGRGVGIPASVGIEIMAAADAAAVAEPEPEPEPVSELAPAVLDVSPEPVPEPEPVAEMAPAVYDIGAACSRGMELPAYGVIDYAGLGWYMCHSNTWQGGVVASLRAGDTVVADGVSHTVEGVTRAPVGAPVDEWRSAYADYTLFSTCIEDGSNDVYVVYAV